MPGLVIVDPEAWGGGADPLTAPTPPATQLLASTATTASLTWTHSTAPAGTTYALTCTDELGTPVSASSGSGLGPYVIPVASGKSYIARLRATGPDGQLAQSSTMVAVGVDVAGDYPVDGSAGWRPVYTGDWTADSAQGPLAAGSGSVTLGGTSLSYNGYAATGTFGTNNNTQVIPGTGLKTALTTTGGQMIQMYVDIPLGETLTAEHALRVRLKLRASLGDTTDSVFVYLSDPGITPAWDSASTAKTGGVRLFNAAQYGRRGGSASGAGGVSSAWVDGSTALYLDMVIPQFGADVVFRLGSTLGGGTWGRSNSRDTSPTLTLQSWLSGLSTIRLFFAVGNGSAGSGLPWLATESCTVEIR